MKKRWNKTAGFTLVELIVVIAILGILAGVAVPVYSGYVKKANLAADQTLVDSINTAFAAACLENVVDINNLPSTPVLDINDTTGLLDMDASTLVNDDVKSSFTTYFGANASTAFKVAKDIVFNPATQLFEIVGEGESVTVTIGGIQISINPQLAAALSNDNTFKALGANKLMDKVDKVSDIAASLVGYYDDSGNPSVFTQMIFEDDGTYVNNLAGSLNMSVTELENLLGEQADGGQAFLANSLVLTAAQKTQSMDTSFLGTTGSAATLRAQLDNPATATDAMAKLALTYGMYTAYVNYANTNPDVPDMEDKSAALLEQGNFTGMTDILAEIESEGFRNYLADEQGQKDMDAYMASMQIVNDSANQSAEATQDILINGFGDELAGVLNNLMGN